MQANSFRLRFFLEKAANRLVGITNGTHVSEFTYDGLSRQVRILEKDNGSTVSDKRFVWCSTELCEERDSTGATVTKRFTLAFSGRALRCYPFQQENSGNLTGIFGRNFSGGFRFGAD